MTRRLSSDIWLALLFAMIGCKSASPAPSSSEGGARTEASATAQPRTAIEQVRPVACSSIADLAGVGVTRDLGQTTVSSQESLVAASGITQLIALDAPTSLLAAARGVQQGLWLSRDAGCHWKKMGGQSFHFLAPAPGGRAYGLAAEGADASSEDVLYAWIGESIGAVAPAPRDTFSIGVDRNDAKHLRAVTRERIFDSRDAGNTWSAGPFLPSRTRGPSPSPWSLGLAVSYVAFSPTHIDHMLVGGTAGGPQVTVDGGRTWTPCQGIPSESTRTGGLAFSDDDHAWAIIHVDTSGDRRQWHYYRSKDGGGVFSELPAAPDRGPVAVVAEPGEEGGLVAVDRHFIARFDERTSLWETHDWMDANIASAAVSSSDPRLLYLGVELPGATPVNHGHGAVTGWR